MRRSYSQKEIYEYLKANPLKVNVHIGDLEDMNGKDYIFLDFLNDIAMLRDNDACYQTVIQISVLTKQFKDRKILVRYIKDKFLSNPTYSFSDEHEYYMAQFTTGVFLNEQNETREL